MTITHTDTVESVQTTTDTSYYLIRTKTFNIPESGKDWRILITAEFTISNKNDRADLEIRLDDSPIDNDSFSPSNDANEAHKFMTMWICEALGETPLSAGDHTLKVYAKSTTGNTVSVRRLRLSVDKY